MSKASKKGTISSDQAKQWREQIRTMTQAMVQEQTRLEQQLNGEQSSAVQNRLQETKEQQQRLMEQSNNLDAALDMEQPDPALIRERTRTMEQTVNKFQKQQRTMAYEAGLTDQT